MLAGFVVEAFVQEKKFFIMQIVAGEGHFAEFVFLGVFIFTSRDWWAAKIAIDFGEDDLFFLAALELPGAEIDQNYENEEDEEVGEYFFHGVNLTYGLGHASLKLWLLKKQRKSPSKRL